MNDNSNTYFGQAICVRNLSKNYLKGKGGRFVGLGRGIYDEKTSSDIAKERKNILFPRQKSPAFIPLKAGEKRSSALANLGVGVSFEVERGEIFGIIGPDGAGKTTLFRILTTLLLADSGSASVDGFDVVKDFKAIRNIVGYMPGRFSLYQDLTVEENLNVFAKVFKTTIHENYHLVEDIYKQLEPFKNRRAGKLSGGMKQKLALCCALIHKPTVLFLDEPTTGVDPVSRKEFWEMLKRLKQQGITILVSTPYMDEAALCNRIALIQHGQFLKIDTPKNIIDQFQTKLWAVKSENMSKLLSDLKRNDGVETCFAFGDCHHITLKREQENYNEVVNYLTCLGHQKVQIERIKPSIEDIFMALAKREERA